MGQWIKMHFQQKKPTKFEDSAKWLVENCTRDTKITSQQFFRRAFSKYTAQNSNLWFYNKIKKGKARTDILREWHIIMLGVISLKMKSTAKYN